MVGTAEQLVSPEGEHLGERPVGKGGGGHGKQLGRHAAACSRSLRLGAARAEQGGPHGWPRPRPGTWRVARRPRET
eukprot:14448845-Alexandrium_andersonii.AAC.1